VSGRRESERKEEGDRVRGEKGVGDRVRSERMDSEMRERRE
jgi:hypothetical protein